MTTERCSVANNPIANYGRRSNWEKEEEKNPGAIQLQENDKIENYELPLTGYNKDISVRQLNELIMTDESSMMEGMGST